MKKKKILFITNIPSPYRIDFFNEFGKYTELTVVFEAKGASDQGIKFDWNYENISNFKAIFLSDGDIKENRINFNLFKKINFTRYDMIFVTSYSYMTEMAGIIYLKIRRIPYFMEIDGGTLHKENVIKRHYKKFLISGAMGYFSPSKKTDEYLIYYGVSKDDIYRYPFTSLKEEEILNEPIKESEKKTLKRELNVKEDVMILGIGQFIYRKGWDVLLKAAAKLQNKGIGLYIVGGEITDEYINIKRVYGLSNVHFKRFIPKEQIKKYYKAADIFTLPTREDIWGLVVNEALSFGLPVITTDQCGAGVELINSSNGIIVKSDCVDQLYDALSYLINKISDTVERNNYAKSALKTANKYTIQAMVREHIKLILNYGRSK